MPDVIFAGPTGRLEGKYQHQKHKSAPIALILHPHPRSGGTMNHRVAYELFYAFQRRGCSVLRFNFRGVGRSSGSFDNGIGEIEDLRAGLDFMSARYPEADLWSAGFSFGAYVSLAAGAADDRVSRLIGIAPALHMYDFSFLETSHKPKYFVQGEKDEICPLAHLQAFFEQLPPPKTLQVVPGANHLFNGKVEEVGAALVRLLATEQR